MNKVIPIIHARKRRRAERGKNPAGRAGLIVAAALSLLFSLAIISSAFLFSKIAQDLPHPEELQHLLSPPDGLLLEPTQLYDRDGNQVLWRFENPLLETRQYVTLDALAETEIASATVVAADPDFWSRANWQLLNMPDAQESSISLRLVSDLLFWAEPQGLPRQLRERVLAAQTIAQFGRQQVLEWYLNNTYYGHQLYGIESAARVYFGKSAPDLNLAEAALLAAVGEAPALNPFDAPQAARERQAELLHTMLKEGAITSQQVRQATQTDLDFQEPPAPQTTPAFVSYVLGQAALTVPEKRLERGGFKIITSLDADLQNQAACTIRHQLTRAAGEEAETDPDCQAARLLPSLPESALAGGKGLTANLVILDPQNGQLLAMVGYGPQGRDSSLGESRTAGTILTPFLYLTAFTQGDNPATLVWDIPTASLTAPETHPNCEQNCQYQGPVRSRIALANDYLSPAMTYWEKLGQANITNILHQLGLPLRERACPACQTPWDKKAITLLDIAHAYSTLGNQGVLMGWPSSADSDSALRPVSVLGIEDGAGKVWRAEPAVGSRPVISAQLAYLTTHILADESARWPSLGHPNILEIGRPVGVKIGHVGDSRSAWAVGYTPQRLTAVWAGREGEPSAESPTTSGPEGATTLPQKTAAGLWRALTQYATRDLPPLGWDAPTGISTMDVCDPSGMLPTQYCPSIVSEVFITGREPVQGDTLYQVREINRETGRLATIFTPPELIEERVYLIVPPQADEWAAGQGVSTPPDAYDLIVEPSFSENLTISEPQNFAYLRGEVPIVGTVTGSDFVSYQIRLGKGHNPRLWQQYGPEVREEVVDDLLWEWDTTGFEDGLYALQVIVAYQEQRVEKTTLLVSVDNTPPELSLSNLEAGQVFSYQSGQQLIFQAQASDNLGVEVVEFTLDGDSATRVEPPFVFAWDMKVGDFTLRVVARDLAGNRTDVEIPFSVQRE
ncbi:MAG: Penicillin-binding protein 2D [Chloroflexi bacterium]|nr:Penicillin-binding protein 2D [Chloroflexota bacterium]